MSTRKRIGPPLIWPSAMKWPSAPAARVMLCALEPEPPLLWVWPRCSTLRLPSTSMVARSLLDGDQRDAAGALPDLHRPRRAAVDRQDGRLGRRMCRPGKRRPPWPPRPRSSARSAIECRTMKPVAIFRHARSEGPAYFATYLERRAIPWKLFALDEGPRGAQGRAQVFRARLHGRADERQ